MFVDPFYYQTDRDGLHEGMVDANGDIWLADGARKVRFGGQVRPTFGGYYARLDLEGLIFHIEGDTPGHAAADLLKEVGFAANELARRAAERRAAYSR